MRKIIPSLALSAAFIAAPAFAQSEDAAEAAVEAAEAVAETVEEIPTKKWQPPSPATPVPRRRLDQPAVDVPRAYSTKRSRDPRLKNFRFIKPVDYPIAAWQEGEEGSIRYKVEVDAAGKALSCEVTDGAELVRLAAATCPLVMERAEFRPARNEEGEDVAGTYEGTQRWRKREPELPQMSLVFQYLHDENGVSSDCKFLKMENIPEKMRKDIERDKERGDLCSGPARGQRGIPYRDENGVPIAKRVTFSVDVQLEDPAAASSE